MFSFIRDLFMDAAKEQIKPHIEKLFHKSFWREAYSRYLFSVEIVFLIAITIYALWQRFIHSIRFLSLDQIRSHDESKFINDFLDTIGEFSLTISIFIILLIVVLSIIGFKKGRITWKFVTPALFISLLILGGNFLLEKIEPQLTTMVKAWKLSEAILLWDNGKFDEAINIFYGIYVDDPQADVADDALGRIGGAYYNTEQYKGAILVEAKLLHDYPSSDVRDETLTTLHWGIYQLGQQMELEETIKSLEAIKNQYPTPEVSPIWIGIPPDVHELVWEQDPFSFASDTYRSLSFPEDDQKKLSVLIDMYPNDPYTDYGLFLLGRYDIIINEYPNSRIIDWAYYAKSKHAFVGGDFTNAAIDYQNFHLKFPLHDWADDAAYMAGMANLQLGDDSKFLQEMYVAISLPDGDMTNAAKRKILWFANGLPSETINELISSSTDSTVKELLVYTLGKQLIVENRYQEAKATFDLLCANPTPEIAQHCTDNIETLKFILDHEESTPENLLAIAELLATKESFFDNEFFYGYGKSIDNDWESIQKRNNFFQTILWANDLVEKFPNSQLIPTAWCLIGDSYQSLSYLGSNLPSEGVAIFDGYDVFLNKPYNETNRYRYRVNADLAYGKCIASSLDSEQIANAYIQRGMIYMYPPWDFNRARDYFSQFVAAFPQHASANNALIWVARTYVRDAVHAGSNNVEKKAYLLEAHVAYERVLRDYPDGHVADEALEELKYVEKLLSEIPED